MRRSWQATRGRDRTTILVVEDDETVRELVRKALAPLGTRVLVAGSATEALVAAAGTHIDLLLTDVGLPGASGTELATELRATQPALRVIYMTGWQEHNALADVPDGLLLSKPFDLAGVAAGGSRRARQEPVKSESWQERHTTERRVGATPMIDALSADVLQTLHEVQFPVGLIDLARRVQWQNPASIALIGDVRGKLDASVVAPEDLEEARVQFARKLMGARHTEHEVTVICADGTRARLETSSVPIMAGGSVVGVLAMGRVDKRDSPSESAPRLTPRERQTLMLLAAGARRGRWPS